MAFALITQQDPENLSDLTTDDEIKNALSDKGKEGIEPVAVPHIVKEMLTGLRAMELLSKMKESDETMEAQIDDAIKYVRNKCLRLARRYGNSLNLAYANSREFCLSSNYKDANAPCEPTLANFDAVTQDLTHIRAVAYSIQTRVKSTLQGYPDFDFGGVDTYAESVLADAYRVGPVKDNLLFLRDKVFGDPAVRLALKNRDHVDNSRLVHEGAYVIEGATIIGLLNDMHSKVYGRESKDAMGMALGGPPGLGKTAVASHYIKSVLGIDPVSIDIDPGQSSFTLMAKPRLIESDPVSATLTTIKQISEMDHTMLMGILEMGGDELKTLCNISDDDLSSDKRDVLKKKMSTGLKKAAARQMAGILTTTEKRGPYVYGPIYEALERNVPVIVNEVQHLRNTDFLHSLLTAIPATDEEAGPMPSFIPSEGQEAAQPKGWFFSTLTGKWMRVPHRFRIFFTGNIGAEFGNQGLPPALVSRLGDRLQEMPVLPPEEQVDIAWAWASDNDGRCMVSTREALKLYHLITEVIPEIERLQNQKSIRGVNRTYFSIRTLINVSRGLNPRGMPQAMRKEISLEEAIFDQFIQPAIANRNIASLEIAAAVLFAAGYITDEMMDRISTALPEIKTDQLKSISNEISGDTELKFDLEKQKEETYEDSCVVCGVGCCPAHSESVQEHIDDITFQADSMTVGINKRAIEKIVELQRKLAGKSQWEFLLKYLVRGISENVKITDIFTPEQISEFKEFIENKLNNEIFNDSYSPQRCLRDLEFIGMVQEIGLGLDVLESQEERINKYIQEMVDHYFVDFTDSTLHVDTSDSEEGEDGGKKKRLTTLSSDQLRVLKAVDTAKNLGYETDISKFKSLRTAVKFVLGRDKAGIKSTTKKGKKRKIFVKSPFEYVKFLGIVHRLYEDDENMMKYLKEKHFTSKTNELIFTVLSIGFGLHSDQDQEDSPIKLRPSSLNINPPPIRKGRKQKFPLKTYGPDESEILGDELEVRIKLLDAVCDWKDMLFEVIDEGNNLLADSMPELLSAQKSWIKSKIDEIIENEELMKYLELIHQLARAYEVELGSFIERLVKPPVFKAPPMREF